MFVLSMIAIRLWRTEYGFREQDASGKHVDSIYPYVTRPSITFALPHLLDHKTYTQSGNGLKSANTDAMFCLEKENEITRTGYRSRKVARVVQLRRFEIRSTQHERPGYHCDSHLIITSAPLVPVQAVFIRARRMLPILRPISCRRPIAPPIFQKAVARPPAKYPSKIGIVRDSIAWRICRGAI